MEFVCYHDWTQLPESADALFARGARNSLFFSRPWFENLARTALEAEQRILLACVVDQDQALAILPLKYRPGESGYALSTSHYTSLFSVMIGEDRRDAIATCLAHGLRQLPFPSFCLEPVDEDDPNLRALRQAMATAGFVCYRSFRFYNWIHRLEGQTFAEYLANRPAKLRNSIARKQRKLQREHGYEIRICNEEDYPQGLADYQAIYQASWKAREPYVDFLPGLAREMSRLGCLRLAILKIAGQPAAGQLWLVAHGKAHIFRLAHDQAWKSYSPGSILTLYLMRHVMEIDQVTEIDFLTGNEAYKQDWMSERRERWGLRWGLANPPKPENGITRWLHMGLKPFSRYFRH